MPMRGKSSTCRRDPSLSQGLRPTLAKFLPCQGRYDSKCETHHLKRRSLFITAVGKDRLPIFRTEAIKSITCGAIDEARTSCGFLLFAYVIMPDHFHVVTDRPREPSTVLQFIKGIVSRRVLGHLKEMKYEA